MRYSYIPLLAALALVGTASAAYAQGPAPASCKIGTAQADLGINNALGRVFNSGSLFYGGSSSAFYFVPKSSNKSPVYASGLWVGGLVDGKLRVAGGTYGAPPAMEFTFWPGPLGTDGQPVGGTGTGACAPYDKIYSATQNQITAARTGSGASGDAGIWPINLGAPYYVDSNSNNKQDPATEPTIRLNQGDAGYGVSAPAIDYGAGQRPAIEGDQGLWWVMNDVGNVHPAQGTPPLGIEVRVLAFAFSRADALGTTTFYRYQIINKSGTDITKTYVSLFSDPDLGNSSDDYVGSDVGAGLAFVYNADNDDSGSTGYGAAPPAIGYDFFQGPIVGDGDDAGSDPDTLGTTAFSYFLNNGPEGSGDPNTGQEIYNYQQGLWGDGSTMTDYGTGFRESKGQPTKFAFPGDPVAGNAWSEINNGTNTGNGSNPPGDRRFAVHTGPFTLSDGDSQDIVFGIVYGRGSSNISSITVLRAADRLAQTAYDLNFQLPAPPPPPEACAAGDAVRTPGSGRCFEAIERNGQATLVWGYPATSDNFLGKFENFDTLLGGQGARDSTYNFEGFNIYRYTSSAFATDTRTLVMTFDKDNGVTTVTDSLFDAELGDLRSFVVARGTDSGLQYSLQLPNLTNFTDYFYGITAYSYNRESTPRINESAATTITVRPSRLTRGQEAASVVGDSVSTVAVAQRGGGIVKARVVDPTAVTGDRYEVRFFSNDDGTINYNIVNTTKGTLVLNGADVYAQTGASPQQIENIITADGLSFSVTGPVGKLQVIEELSTDRSQIIDSNVAFSLNSAANPPRYLVTANGIAAPSQVLGRIDWQGNIGDRAPIDYEFRFPADPDQNGQIVLNRQWEGAPGEALMKGYVTADSAAVFDTDGDEEADSLALYGQVVRGGPQGRLPFQVWEVNLLTGTETQVAAAILDDSEDLLYGPSIEQQPYSLGNADAVYERIYVRSTPYDEALILTDPEAANDAFFSGIPTIGRFLFVPFTVTVQPPAPGTVVRLRTNRPNLPDDVFVVNTDSLNIAAPTAENQELALDRIAVVPNPYYGVSSYETGNLDRAVRFTNLPEQAVTIQIFTVSGSLVNTLRKEGSARSLDWNLESSNNLPVASGMYLISVEVAAGADGMGGGNRTLKLGVINRRTQITVF